MLLTASAQEISWVTSLEGLGNGEFNVVLKGSVPSGWHVYSMFTPDGGPMQTMLEFGKGIVPEGDAVEGEPEREFDELFEVEVWYFSESYEVSQRVKVEDPDLEAITGTITYQLCQPEGSCMLLTHDFSVEIPENAEVVSVAPAATDTPSAGREDSLWLFFWLAFLGGLAAVIMPCVFPMIPMTVSFFMHSDTDKRKARLKALFYALSIIFIYTVIGLIITVFLGADFTNWLSTNWLPNLFFFVIFMIFAASFLGAFEIVLPSWLVNKSDAQADRGGYLGAFFMAFTLVLVSFSCTAPIVGTILVEAARGSVLRPVVGMFGFSLAVALPFGFFAFFPSRLSSLPKSGGWLNSVKVVLGFIEIALGFKFLMVIDQTYNFGLLDREIYIAIWIVVFALMGFYLMRSYRLKNDDEDYCHKPLGVGRLTLVIIVFTFVVYLIPGMFGAPLKALAGYLPPQESMDFDLNRIVRDHVRSIAGSGVSYNSALSEREAAKWSDILHLPHGLSGYFDYDQALRVAQAEDKPLFIDFTGKGCVNCREMEQSVWSDPRVLELLEKEFVVCALYVDVKADLPEEEQYISEYDGKLKNTLGKKNADFQIKMFDSNAQPNYILLDSRHGDEADLRPYVLAPARGYNKDVDAFIAFLNEALTAYKAGE